MSTKTDPDAPAIHDREKEMRESDARRCETTEELAAYIDELLAERHDYGTCVYAMSLAATAAFNLVASKLGVTNFQASCADLDFIRRSRHMEGPFILLKAEDMVYPQYDLHAKLEKAISGWMAWVSEKAKTLLDESDLSHVHPNVHAHWVKLAALNRDRKEGSDE